MGSLCLNAKLTVPYLKSCACTVRREWRGVLPAENLDRMAHTNTCHCLAAETTWSREGSREVREQVRAARTRLYCEFESIDCMVPRDRIELSTPAFSGLCSTN